MTKKVQIGTLQFKSKTAAIAHFRSIAERYKLYEPITDLDRSHLEMAFKNHPDYQTKSLDREILHFERHPNKGGSHCFYARFKDEAKIDFSMKKCIY